MVRQRPRKAFEELYGSSKYETNKSHSTSVPVSKSMRCERELGGYLIQSNTPFTTMNLPPGVALSAPVPNTALVTSRRKTTGTARMTHNRTNNGSSHYAVDDLKKDLASNKNKGLTNSRLEKGSAYSGAGLCENKHFPAFGTHTHAHVQPPIKDLQQNTRTHSHSHHHHHQHQQQQQQPSRHVAGMDDEKDDDADEFFDVIKNTVENAVGKAISDLLNKNFRDLSAKIDRFSTELKSTNTLLNKLQTDVNNKVVHYGEENSRHFRYLCMKSEYDKMFYQQANPIASNEVGVSSETKQKNSNATAENTPQTPCTCRPSSSASSHLKLEQTTNNKNSHKVALDEVSMGMGPKSSAVDMRDVIDHIQRFFTQIQMTGMLDSRQLQAREPSYHSMDPLESMKAHKKLFEEEDEDDSQMSSDGMTPRSEQPFGGTTMRSTRRSSVVANIGDGDN